MQYPQILVYETDGQLAAMLRETAKIQRWAMRKPRKAESCLRLLRSLCPSVVIRKMGTYAKREAGLPLKEEEERRRAAGREKEQIHSLDLLAKVHELFPDAALVAVGDAEDVGLGGLAWEYGASYVLVPPMSRQMLAEVVVGLMHEAIAKGKH